MNSFHWDSLRVHRGIRNKKHYNELVSSNKDYSIFSALLERYTFAPRERHRSIAHVAHTITSEYLMPLVATQKVFDARLLHIITPTIANDTSNIFGDSFFGAQKNAAIYLGTIDRIIWRAPKKIPKDAIVFHTYLLCHEYVHAQSCCELSVDSNNVLRCTRSGLLDTSLRNKGKVKFSILNEAIVDTITLNALRKYLASAKFPEALTNHYDKKYSHDIVTLENGERRIFAQGYVEARRALAIIVDGIANTCDASPQVVMHSIERMCVLGLVEDMTDLLDCVFGQTIRNLIAAATTQEDLLSIAMRA